MKRVVVIGLGIFGINLVKQLFESGLEVLAIDKRKEAVQEVKDFSTKAIVADGTDRNVMETIGVREEDVVVVSFGEDLAASTLATLHLKQMKVQKIIVKAPNDEHKLILEKVGATEVIIPEKEMANKIAKGLISPNVLDYIPLTENYIICEIAPPSSFIGKSIAQLQLRGKHHIEVIAVRDVLTDQIQMVPRADFVIKDDPGLLDLPEVAEELFCETLLVLQKDVPVPGKSLLLLLSKPEFFLKPVQSREWNGGVDLHLTLSMSPSFPITTSTSLPLITKSARGSIWI